jgi:hypothetical protein
VIERRRRRSTMNTDTPTSTPEVTRTPVETLDFCCGGRRCPTVTLFSDGTLTTTDGDQKIEYTAEQVVRLRSMLIGTLPR